MAIIALRAWYLREYEPLRELEKRPHDLRLSKNSLLKSALRADFLDEVEAVKQSEWFQHYLEGGIVEFYIEGSGGYCIANIDLVSHEIYFTKREVMAHLEPSIFFCYQTDYAESGDRIRAELEKILTTLNEKSRLPLTLTESHRLGEGPVRLNSTLMRKIRTSLLFIADTTPIAQLPTDPPQVLPNPAVCVEMGYALHSKHPEQVLTVQMERPDLPGQFPFDLPSQQRLSFKTAAELHRTLPEAIVAQLKRYNLFP
ncbi:hypothetical protein [Trichothermofontia sp.]